MIKQRRLSNVNDCTTCWESISVECFYDRCFSCSRVSELHSGTKGTTSECRWVELEAGSRRCLYWCFVWCGHLLW